MQGSFREKLELTNALPAAAAKGQVIVGLSDLVGDGAFHREPVRVEAVSIAPVARIPAHSPQKMSEDLGDLGRASSCWCQVVQHS